MQIDIFISDRRHPLWPAVADWAAKRPGHRIALLDRLADAGGGDCLVMVACHEIASPETRGRYRRCLVTHGSDLPQGRGWSPVIWDVLGGKDRIVLSLIEAADPVDSGAILQKFQAVVKPTDLHDDINSALSRLVIGALDFVLQNPDAASRQQEGEASWYRRRVPDDSRLDPSQSIASQFNLLRACDPARFPAFFELLGERFEVVIRKTKKVRPS